MNPFTAAAPGQRHAIYAAMTAAGPVHAITLPNGMPAWLVTGYDEIRAAMVDPRLVKSGGPVRNPGMPDLPPDIDAALNSDLLHLDPPHHTRLRRLVSTAFTRRRVDELAPRVQLIADELLDAAVSDRGEVDLIAAYANPLPFRVICELLGVPPEEQPSFGDWSSTLLAGSLSTQEAWTAAAAAFVGYVRELLAAKRAEPADDLLSALVAVRDGSDRLSENELTSMVFLLLVAGHETTVHLISNGMHALLNDPDQLAILRAEPERLDAAIEELLRFDGPIQLATFRWSVEPVEIGGTTIPAGQVVMASLLAANRDPAHFADPDVMDVTRADASHLAFGHGVHHCLGAPLARLEGRIALGTLLARFPDLRLAVSPAEISWQPGLLMHGLAALPVALHAGSSTSPAGG